LSLSFDENLMKTTTKLLELTHIAGLEGITIRLDLESWNGKLDTLQLTAIPRDPAFTMKCGLGLPHNRGIAGPELRRPVLPARPRHSIDAAIAQQRTTDEQLHYHSGDAMTTRAEWTCGICGELLPITTRWCTGLVVRGTHHAQFICNLPPTLRASDTPTPTREKLWQAVIDLEMACVEKGDRLGKRDALMALIAAAPVAAQAPTEDTKLPLPFLGIRPSP
jgi:hypothetical protein